MSRFNAYLELGTLNGWMIFSFCGHFARLYCLTTRLFGLNVLGKLLGLIYLLLFVSYGKTSCYNLGVLFKTLSKSRGLLIL